MICPTCGGELKAVPMGVAGDEQEAFRCYTCGGFWVNGWLVNRINAKILDKFAGEGGPAERGKMGSNVCPKDGEKLERFTGESVPQDVTTLRCGKCGWWWFPGDNLFRYKPAQEAKINYFKSWGLAASVSALLLPVLSVAVLIGGAVVATQLVQMRQQVPISASSPVSNVSMTYVGGGVEVVGFVSIEPVTKVEYKSLSELIWQGIEVQEEKGFYMVRLVGLVEGQQYKLKILDKEYEFVTK